MRSLVLFDLDGTLLDESGLPAAMDRTCAAVAAASGVPAADLRTANDDVWASWWPDVEDEWMLGGGRAGAELTAEAWRRTLARCGVEDALDLATRTWAREALAAHRLFPEVRDVLGALRTRGIRTGLVSNGAADLQRAKLAAVGLDGLLDPVVVSSEAGERKPGAAIFRVALGPTAPGDAVFVGDNLWHDVPGAVEAGIETVWLDRAGVGAPGGAPVPDGVVRDLRALTGTAFLGRPRR